MTDKSFDVEKALAMVSGQDMGKFYDVQVLESDKALLRDALENIFQGSSVILWIHGGTLGDAWHTALDNMRDEFFATSRRDVFTVFLQYAVFEHRNKWMEKIRTNDNRGQTFNMLQVGRGDSENMLKQAEFQKQQGYDTIKKLIEKYDSGVVPVQKPVAKMDAHIMDMVNSRENEREHVRERTK